MKHISPILASIALLASLDAVAQTTPRMPMPVPGINVQQLYMAHQKKANDMAKKSDRIYIPTTPGVRVMSQAETARAEAKTKETGKKTLITKMEMTSDNGRREYCNVTYNEYGHFKTLDYGTYKMQYDYEYGYGNHWTKKTVTRVDGNYSIVESKEERTLDNQGRVTSIKRYEQADEKLALASEEAYEYTHNAGGMLVKKMEYNTYDGSVNSGLIRQWFAPKKSYVEAEWHNYSEKLELSIGADYYEVKCYEATYPDHDNYVLTRTERHYYTADGKECGNELTRYNNGKIESKEGSKTEYQYNTPEKGYTTTITNRIDENGMWTKAKKTIATDNYNDPLIPFSGSRSEKEYLYNSNDDSWALLRSCTKEWTEQGYLKQVEVDNEYEDESGTYYYMYDDKGEKIGYVYPFGNGDYVLEVEEDTEESKDIYTCFYTFYDKKGNITRQIKYVENQSHKDEYTNTEAKGTFYELKNGTWQILSGKISIGDGDNHIEATLNEKGWLTESREYKDGKVYKRNLYEYTASGYTETSYCILGGQLNKNSLTSVSKDAKGTYTYVHYTYDAMGNVTWARKYVTYANGIQDEYNWDDDRRDFGNAHTSATDLVSTDDQGVTTTIQRVLDPNTNTVVETEKYEEYNTYNRHWSARYTKEDGKWVGTYKEETITSDYISFKVNPLQDPLKANDEYFSYTDDGDKDLLYTMVPLTILYYWNNGEWKIKSKSGREYLVDDNKYIEKEIDIRSKENGYYSERTIVSETTRDANYNIVESNTTQTEITKEPQYDEATESMVVKTSKHNVHEAPDYYTYDSEQRLTKKVSENYDTDYLAKVPQRNLTGRETTVYYYAEMDVVVGIDNVGTNNARPMFAVSGRNISLVNAAPTAMSLYTIDGQLVATSTNGQLTAPANGMYIVKSNGMKAKVVVK
ncbi:hypothetical protein [uncultured Prevotella sp.]|uniref:hypothetical protein n=1 Tax=uncultured Prevotella sp. TaxID=159272 RepID=UPI0027E26FFF|nr:hypothetical protein [uncultured Prevotella sp.]